MVACILAITLSTVEPAQFMVNVNANPEAVYVVKVEGVIVQVGQVYQINFPTNDLKGTITYLSEDEEITLEFTIQVKPGYRFTQKLRLENCFPAIAKI